MSPNSTVQPVQRRYLAVPFEAAKVRDVMRVGVVSCRPETSMYDVAHMMTTYEIHSVVVADVGGSAGGERPWGIVSDLDLVRAAGPDAAERTAGELARTELVTVPADETLERAARLMAEHEVTHLVAVQPETGQPVGVISALGLAAVLAQSRRRVRPEGGASGAKTGQEGPQ